MRFSTNKIVTPERPVEVNFVVMVTIGHDLLPTQLPDATKKRIPDPSCHTVWSVYACQIRVCVCPRLFPGTWRHATDWYQDKVYAKFVIKEETKYNTEPPVSPILKQVRVHWMGNEKESEWPQRRRPGVHPYSTQGFSTKLHCPNNLFSCLLVLNKVYSI
jgi:hypothetical protein